MTLTFHLLWMLCALGAVACAAVPAAGWRRPALLAGAFLAAMAWFSLERLPDSALIGVTAALVGAAALVRPGRVWLAVITAGLLAGAWGTLLEAMGLPAASAPILPATSATCAMWMASRRAGFVDLRVREEAMLGLVIGGLFVAMLPGVLDGWRAAVALNLEAPAGEAAPAALIPVWTLMLGATALSAGALYSVWSRR